MGPERRIPMANGTSAVGIVGPLAFVVVLELARLARDIPMVGHDGETERLEYDDPSGVLDRTVTGIATRLGFDGQLVSAGGFYVVFMLTEVVLYGSAVIVYLTTGALTGSELSEVGVGAGVTAFLVLVWLLLPVIVVDRYDDLARRGIRPLSMNVHIVTTLLWVAVLVAMVEGRAALGIEVTDRVQEAGILVVGFSTGFISAKSALYRRYLRAELDHLDAEAGTAGPTGTDGAVTADVSGDVDGP